MAVADKIPPYSGLCKFCINLTKTQRYAPDVDEHEGILHLACSAIPGLVFTDINEQYSIGNTEVDESIDLNALSLLVIDTNISSCNRFLPGAKMAVDLVEYVTGAGPDTLTITYSIQGANVAGNINFYLVGQFAAIGAQAVANGSGQTISIVTTLASGNYYMYAQLDSSDMTIIYPFIIP